MGYPGMISSAVQCSKSPPTTSRTQQAKLVTSARHQCTKPQAREGGESNPAFHGVASNRVLTSFFFFLI
jgi:hypothetical protein